MTPKELFDSHVPWALKLAKTIINGMGISRSLLLPGQLEQAALIALWGAAERFDEKNGASFKTFCVRQLRGRIIDELRNEGPVWRQRYRHEGSVQHIDALKDVLCGHATRNETDENEELRAVMLCLTEQEQIVVRGKLAGDSFVQISKRMERSESRVCQLMKSAKDKLLAEMERRRNGTA